MSTQHQEQVPDSHPKNALAKLNARFARTDAALPAELKRERPIRSWEEIQRRYPDQWVLVQPTEVNAGLRVVSGRAFGHAPDRQTCRKQQKAIERRYSGLELTIEFTGVLGPLDWAIA